MKPLSLKPWDLNSLAPKRGGEPGNATAERRAAQKTHRRRLKRSFRGHVGQKVSLTYWNIRLWTACEVYEAFAYWPAQGPNHSAYLSLDSRARFASSRPLRAATDPMTGANTCAPDKDWSPIQTSREPLNAQQAWAAHCRGFNTYPVIAIVSYIPQNDVGLGFCSKIMHCRRNLSSRLN